MTATPPSAPLSERNPEKVTLSAPGAVPVMTTVVLFTVVCALLAFIVFYR